MKISDDVYNKPLCAYQLIRNIRNQNTQNESFSYKTISQYDKQDKVFKVNTPLLSNYLRFFYPKSQKENRP